MAAVLLVCLLALAGAGCSAAGGGELSSMTSDVRPEDPGLEIDESLEGFGEDVQEFFGDVLEDLDLGDITEGLDEAIPGLGPNTPECAELMLKYTTLFVDAAQGAPAKDIQKDAAEIKKALPKDLHDELDTMVSAAIELAESDQPGGGELITPEYSQADVAITEYLVDGCSSEATD